MFLRFKHGLVTDFGVASCSESFGEAYTELDFFSGEAGRECSDIRVEGEKFRAFHSVKRDSLQHVGARSAEADDFDGGGGDRVLRVADVGDHGDEEFER